MKRFKFLPAIIMLALCVGVIAIGIYAATPANNNISGTIRVNSSSAQISVTALVGEDVVMETKTTRYGFTETIPNILEFNVEDKETVSEVDEIVLTIRVQNNSKNKELGAYFYGGNSQTPPTEAVYSDIKQTGQVLDTKTQTAFVSETYNENSSGYKHLMPDDDDAQTTNNIVDLTVTFRLIDLYDDEKQGQFTLVLNVEEYNPNFTEDGVYSGNDEFVKVSSSISNNLNSTNLNGGAQLLSAAPLASTQTRTTLAANAFAGTEAAPNTNLKMVVIPSTVTTIGNNAFAYCTNLSDIYFGSKAIILGTTPFAGIESSTKLKAPLIETSKYKLENGFLNVKENVTFASSELAIISSFIKEVYIPTSSTYDSLESIKHAKIERSAYWDPDSLPLYGFIYENGVLKFTDGVQGIGRPNTHIGLESVVKEIYMPSSFMGGIEPHRPGVNGGCFGNFTLLDKVVFPDNANYTISCGTFLGCTSLKYVYIPTGITLDSCYYDENGATKICSPFAGCHTDLKIFYAPGYGLIDGRERVKESCVYAYGDSTEWRSAELYDFQTNVTKEQYTQLTGQTLD